jgi:trimeric autotransporter adhesin
MKAAEKRIWMSVLNLVAVLELCACDVVAQTNCTGEWTPDVSPRNGVVEFSPGSGWVDALEVFDDGNGPALFAGGIFSLAGGVVSPHAARWTGTQWMTAGLQDEVRDFVTYDSGSGPQLYAATLGGVYRWTGSGWVPVGTPSGGGVRVLEVFDAGSGPVLVAAGNFTVMNGVAASKIAAWNGTTWSPLGSGTNGTVWGLRSWNDGSGPALYVGGSFTSAGAVAAFEVAKWASGAWSALGAGFTGPGSAVVAFEVFDDGTGPHLYAGGDFTHSGGQPRNGVAKWSGGTWVSLGSGLTGSTGFGYIGAYSLCVFDPDGAGSVPAKLVAAGPFQQAGGVQSKLCAAWDGTTWTATSSAGFDSGSVIWEVQSVPVAGGQVLVCGGDFATAAGVSAGQIAQWNGSVWSSIGGGFCQLPAITPQTGVNAVAAHDIGSGPAVFAGGYVGIGGSPFGSYVAKWAGTSVVPLGPAFNGEIEALAVLDDGSGPTLFSGGSFTTVGGAVTGPVVFWSGSAWTPLGAGPPGSAHALVVFDDGTGPAIYSGGTVGISRWTGSAWVLLPGSPVNVRTLAVFDPDGAGAAPPRLFAGGAFQSAGFSINANSISQWDGVSWSNLGTGVTPAGSSVESLVVFDDGTGPSLFVGGWFAAATGLPANGVARWSGSAWFNVGTGVNTGKVDALVACDGPGGVALYACGEFASPGANIARWNGSAWQALGSGLDARARSMTSFDDGTGPAIVVGGRFQRAGNPSGGYASQPSHYLGRWGCARPTVLGIQTGGAGGPISVSNSNLFPGHEYYNVFSSEVCGFGPGNGPYLGLCASDLSSLFSQFALPVGAVPIHFLASSSTAQFGPFTVPPLTVDVVCFDWTGGSLGLHSRVTRFVVQ